MDGGSFRAQRPTTRSGPVNRPPQVQVQQQASPVEPQPGHRALQRPEAARRLSVKRFIIPLCIVIVAAVLVVLGWFLWSRSQSTGVAIDSSKYQAVFFTNGQVYFGKLHPAKNGYMKLTDVYYLQTQNGAAEGSENPQTAAADQGNVQLIKLGEEIHGPEDAMIIAKEQVLFYENLKTDGKVTQSIEKHKSTQ